jgi:hypothetical protein
MIVKRHHTKHKRRREESETGWASVRDESSEEVEANESDEESGDEMSAAKCEDAEEDKSQDEKSTDLAYE